MDFEFYYYFPVPPISWIFLILRIAAIFLVFYTLYILLRFFTEPESETNVGRRREFQKTKNVVEGIDNEELLRAFKTFGLTPNDNYWDASYRYYALRRAILMSGLPNEVKEAKLQEIDRMFELLAEYYSKRG
ncbi:hypothetical protein [Fervidobacterium islandicum]|uniref:hypothetical protein n=1 Tax=Fervidobacterium islandicum TaxID=2423 RepID=UPI003A740827